MKTIGSAPKASRLLFAAGLGLFLASAVHADTVTFTNTPASNAAAELNRRYGITIVFRGAVNSSTPVSFSSDNVETPAGRLQAVSDLAFALGLDFQKVYVVSKIAPGTSVPAVKIDSEAPVVFEATRVPAREAIRTVAAVDGAVVQISRLVQGSVVFPDRRTTTQDAAAAIAKQTQTVWKAYYGLFPRGQGPANLDPNASSSAGDGDAKPAFPLLSFRKSNSRDVPISGYPDAGAGVTPPSAGVPTVATPDVLYANPYDDSSLAYSGLGYNPYGYSSPYGYSYPGYSYPGYGYFGYPNTTPTMPSATTPGAVTPTTGIQPVTPVPSAATTLLPNYPFAGSLGGAVNVGGY